MKASCTQWRADNYREGGGERLGPIFYIVKEVSHHTRIDNRPEIRTLIDHAPQYVVVGQWSDCIGVCVCEV